MNAMVPPAPVVKDGLVWHADHLVLPWMADRIEGMEGLAFGDSYFPATSIGVLGRDRISGEPRIIGGVAYAFWMKHPEGGDVQVSMVMLPGTRVTRRMWRILYGHAFNTMDCRRISLSILRENRRARDHVERAGFKLEAVKQEAHGVRDIMCYGLLRSRCKFLGER